PLAAGHEARRLQPLLAGDDLADRIGILETAGREIEDRGIAGTAWLQRAEIRPAQGGGRRRRGATHDAGERHAEAEELRQGREEVEGRTTDAQLMDVAADHIGGKASGKCGARGAKSERALAVTDVEDHSPGAGGENFVAQAAVAVHRRVRKGAKAMGE